MSQPKRRSRKSKLVPRSTDGAEPEIEEVIEQEEDDDEPPIKIMNTMSLAAPQPGPSRSTESIQFKVDIEVEEWIDDELFIVENFNKMQTEKLSKALDEEITEEADWTNEEYGKIWAEAASDSEQEEKPLNEYEKIIKNQVDPSVLAAPLEDKPSKDRPGWLKDKPGTSKDVRRKDLRPETSKDENGPITRSKSGPPKSLLKVQPKQNEPPPKPIRQYKRVGPKSKTMEVSPGENPSTGTSIDGKSSSDPSVYSKIFKWPNKKSNEHDYSKPKSEMNIIYSDETPTTYHIDLPCHPNIDLPPATLEDQEKTLVDRELSVDDPTVTRRMTISELDEFAKTHIPEPVPKPDDDTMVCLEQIIVTEEEILTKSYLIATETKKETDHILDIELRNRMGNTRFVPIEMSREDALIDFGLREWYKWLGTKKVRSTPLAYKCYICNKGWWHLHPFRVHLKKHVVVSIMFEKQNKNQECCIIAHNGKYSFKMFPIDEECWKCGREYQYHCGLVYTCKGCQSTLFTCKALAEHEGICLNIWKEQMQVQKTKDVKAYKCKICPQIFFTEELLHNHQYRCHVPRSDYPMWVQSSQCNYCNQNYVYYAFHYCNRRVQKCQCRYCSRHFPSVKALKAHMDLTKSNMPCKVCNEIVSKECMMANHLLAHNKNYVLVYKCLMCAENNIMLEDVTMVARHSEYVHKTNKYVRSMWCYAQVPIPTTLYKQKFTTWHTPTPTHEKLKESFIKDLLLGYREKTIKYLVDSLEEKESQDSLEQDSQDTPEEQETPTVKVENVMENYFEEDSSNIEVETEFKPKIIDTTSIKVEIEENLEGTEVNPADLMNMTNSEFLSVVKEEEPEDDFEMDTSQSSDQNMDTSNGFDASTSNNANKDFSVQLLEHLSNRDEEEEELNDNVNFCLNCDFEGTRKQFKAHLKTCDSGEIAKKKQELTCTKCEKDFTSMKDYVQHLPKHGFVRCKCIECDRVFPNLSTWILHIKMHIKKTFTLVKLISKNCKLYRCRFCKVFVERKMFFNHWEEHLEPPKKKKLSQAAVGMEGEGRLSPQILSRIEEIFGITKSCLIPKNCIICEKYFSRMNEKKRHLVEHLLDAASEQLLANSGLVCQFCGVKVLKPDEFRRHMRDHAALTLYHCEFCNKTFSDSSNFVKHKKVHDVDLFTCDVCNKKFLAKTSLKAHIATHRPDPLLCARCPSKLFYSESAYKRHVRANHDRNTRVKCQYCREHFLSLREKWDHLWEEHKVRSQIADCPLCDRKFRKTQDVRAHIYNDHHQKKVLCSFVPSETATSTQ